MQNIYYLLKFFFFFFIIGAVLLFGYWLRIEYKEWKKHRQQKENFYNMKYIWLQELIRIYPVDESNYHYLKNQLMKLGQMEYKNKEKTTLLNLEFFRKYSDIAKECSIRFLKQ